MKRFLAIVLTAVLLVGLLPTTSVAATEYAYVVGGLLRLRTAASFDAAQINSYGTGTRVEILGTAGSWYHVRTPDGNIGYMYGSYLSFNSTGIIDGGSGTATVTSTNGYGVRLRRGPGTGYAIIRKYAVGTVATVLQRGSYWSRISINGVVGYMMNQFLNFGGSSSGGGTTTDANATIWSRNGYGVRLRSGPSKSYSIIGVYSVGTGVKVIEYGTTWCKIQVGSREGYMMTEFLDIRQSTEVTAVTINTTTPVLGDILSVKSITPSGANVSYSWIVNGQVVSVDKDLYLDAASALYEGNQITLSVTGKDGYTGSASVTTQPVVGQREPITSVALNLSSPTTGDTLRVSSVEPEDATYKCTWYVDDKQVSTATTLKVTKTQAENDSVIRLEITGTGLYTGTAEATATATIAPSILSASLYNVTTDKSSITSANVGHKLRIVPNIDTTQVTYQWVIKNTSTGKESTVDSKELTITRSHIGCTITGQYMGTGNYKNSDQWSNAGTVTTVSDSHRITKLTLSPLTNISFRAGSGSTDDTGTKLTASVSSTKSKATSNPDSYFTFTWKNENGDEIGTGRTYEVTANDVGQKINVTVEANNPDTDGDEWTSETFTATTSEIVTAPLVMIQINGGSVNVGDDVSISSTVPAGAQISYVNWYVNNRLVGTGNTYTVKESDARSNAPTELKATAYAASPYTGSRSYTININPYSSASATTAYDVLDMNGVVVDTLDEAAITGGTTPVDDGTTTGDETPSDEVKDEDVKDEEVKDEDVKDEEVKDEDVKDEEVKDEEDKDEEVKDEEDKDEEDKDEEDKDDDGGTTDEQTAATYTAAINLLDGTLSAVVTPVPEATLTYKWYMAGQELVDVTTDTYTLSESDWGQSFTVEITMTEADGTTTKLTAYRTPNVSTDEDENPEYVFTSFSLNEYEQYGEFQNRYVP